MLYLHDTNCSLDTELYTEVQIHHYEAPPGYCFDTLCQDDPIMDNPQLHDYNKDEKIDRFIEWCKEDFGFFKEGPGKRHLIYAMGSDFQYQNANQNFLNLDKLIKYVNEKTAETGIEAIYSTPSCYMKGIYEDYINFYPDFEWATKDDDFFPYASAEHAYWTAYFTSRPTLKYMERQHNNLLQAAKQIQALYANGMDGKIYANQTDINILKRAMATMQHHDAVTGTEKQNVAEDYAQRLSEGGRAVLSFMGPVMFGQAGTPPSGEGLSNFMCPLTNISQCSFTESSDNLNLLIYNPLSRPVSKYVRLPVEKANVQIFDADSNELKVEFVPIAVNVLNIPGRDSKANYEAVFQVKNVPALGYKTYYLKHAEATLTEQILKVRPYIRLNDSDIFTSMAYYIGSGEEPQPSGAYVFRPEVQKRTFVERQDIKEVIGSLVQEYWVTTSNNWTSFVQRQYAGEDHHEVEWLVGPIPEMGNGTEVVMIYSPSRSEPNPDEKQEFWTDSNGRQMIYRLQDTRFSYNLENGHELEPVSSNYYPINSAVVSEVKSKDEVWAILTDRSQGATKINPDEVEIMVHRRLFKDDHFGVGEPLDEHAYDVPLVARGTHYVYRFHQDNPVWRRSKAQELYMAPQIMLQRAEQSLQEWLALEQGNKTFSAVARPEALPSVIHLMTVEKWNHPDMDQTMDNLEILLRFEHMYASEEGGETKDIEFPQDYFEGLLIIDLVELSLGGDRPVGEALNGMAWSKTSGDNHPFKPMAMKLKGETKAFSFAMDPMAIRTFKATVVSSKA